MEETMFAIFVLALEFIETFTAIYLLRSIRPKSIEIVVICLRNLLAGCNQPEKSAHFDGCSLIQSRSEFLFQEMFCSMFSLIVTMDVGPFDIWKALKLVLQIFCNVVSFPERHLWMKDNIDFNSNPRTRVPSSHGVQTDDIRAVCHRYIRDPLEDVSRGGYSYKKMKLRISSTEP